MKSFKLSSLIFLLLIYIGFAGCYKEYEFISITPDQQETINLNLGDSITFEVDVTPGIHRYSWEINNPPYIVSTTYEADETFQLTVDESNACNKMGVALHTRTFGYNGPDFDQLLGSWGWRSRLDVCWWEIRVSQDPPIWYGNYVINNHDDIDALKNYETITGGLYIQNTELTDLSELDNISSIGGDLVISHSTALITLDGLSNITSIKGNLLIDSSDSLSNLEGLNSLVSIGGKLIIQNNSALTSLRALAYLESVSNDIIISGNESLASLEGLNNIVSADGSLIISYNSALSDIDDLDSLISVGGDLEICCNIVLTYLRFDALSSVNGDFRVFRNYSLPTDIVEYLRDRITIGGEIYIEDNLDD